MPAKTQRQKHFMDAVAHGFKPTRIPAPSLKVAQDFSQASEGMSFGKGKGHPFGKKKPGSGGPYGRPF